MISDELRERIDRCPRDVFDFVGTHKARNHPRREPAVLEWRQITPGPLGPGTRGVMVRQDGGRQHEVPEEVVAFEPGRTIALRTRGGPLALRISVVTSLAGAAGTELTVLVQVELRGFLRLLRPVLAARMPRDGAAMMRRIKDLIEAEY